MNILIVMIAAQMKLLIAKVEAGESSSADRNNLAVLTHALEHLTNY